MSTWTSLSDVPKGVAVGVQCGKCGGANINRQGTTFVEMWDVASQEWKAQSIEDGDKYWCFECREHVAISYATPTPKHIFAELLGEQNDD